MWPGNLSINPSPVGVGVRCRELDGFRLTGVLGTIGPRLSPACTSDLPNPQNVRGGWLQRPLGGTGGEPTKLGGPNHSRWRAPLPWVADGLLRRDRKLDVRSSTYVTPVADKQPGSSCVRLETRSYCARLPSPYRGTAGWIAETWCVCAVTSTSGAEAGVWLAWLVWLVYPVPLAR